MMDRRNFFKRMIGGVATAAAVRTWPFRVYSFPAQIQAPVLTIEMLREAREFLLFHRNQNWLFWDEEKQLWCPSREYGWNYIPLDHPLVVADAE